MVYVTGDTHGYEDRFFDERGRIVPAVSGLTNADILIVAGDFGYLFSGSPTEQVFLDRMETLPFQIAFVDGNHENFPLIYRHPVEEWHGGKVHRIRRNIVHLMRGEIFNLQGKTIFVFGGAASIDKRFRQEGLSWWPQEIPNDAEYKNAARNLSDRGAQVDYIITHTCPTYIVGALGFHTSMLDPDAELTGFLEWVAKNSPAKHYRRWYFGHWHLDMDGLQENYRKNLESQRFRPVSFDMLPLK